MSTTVSRRMVSIKMKKTQKPHVPLPKRVKENDELVGEKAKPFAPLTAAVPRVVHELPWWQKVWRPAAIAAGVLACGGFAYFVMNASSKPSYDRAAETASFSSVSVGSNRARMRSAEAMAYPGSETIKENIVLSNRSTPTDESFRATSYVRKKVALPNIAGDCLVAGGGGRDVGDCLRRQMEQ